MLDRVLRCKDEKRSRQLVSLILDRRPALGHRLEQARLSLRCSAIDLIGKNDVRENGSGLELEFACPLIVDGHAYDIGRQEITRELDSLKASRKTSGYGLSQCRLPDTGYVFDEEVTTGEERDDRQADGIRLPADDAFNRLLQLVQSL